MSALNLDHAAATRAQEIVAAHPTEAKDLDRFVTKAAGVFQDEGVFAGFLFLASRSDTKEKKFAATVRKRLLELLENELQAPGLPLTGDRDDWLVLSAHLTQDSGLLTDLDTLFLAKAVIEQTLVYARYGAKAANIESGG